MRVFSIPQYRNSSVVLGSELSIQSAQPLKLTIDYDDASIQRFNFTLDFNSALPQVLDLFLLINSLAQTTITLERRVSDGRAHLTQFILPRARILRGGAAALLAGSEVRRQLLLFLGCFIQLRLTLLKQRRQTSIFSNVNVTQQLAQLFTQDAIASSLGGLTTQTVHLSLNFRDYV